MASVWYKHWATYGVTITNMCDYPNIIYSYYTQLSRAYHICSVIVVIKHINIY